MRFGLEVVNGGGVGRKVIGRKGVKCRGYCRRLLGFALLNVNEFSPFKSVFNTFTESVPKGSLCFPPPCCTILVLPMDARSRLMDYDLLIHSD